MERVLRQQDFSEIVEQDGVTYYPVRHHSPACAYHLLKVMEELRPEAVLIEGPSDANSLIPFLASEQSKPPFCIYYSYNDKDGRISEEKEKYRAYYPFLEYSPELIAIRKAKELGIASEFMDLPYASMLVNRTGPQEIQADRGGNEEYEVNRYTTELAHRAGCRSFTEFWESRFELEAQRTNTREFLQRVYTLAHYMRAATEDDQETLWREQFMAGRIAEAKKKYGKILAVTGAFHVEGLLSPTANLPKLKPHQSSEVGTYLMPYTFREADSKSGYSAGMMFPAYYQEVWKKLSAGKSDAFEAVLLEYIVKTARYARKMQVISLPDEINAFHMAKNLAALRDKAVPGVFELLDGVRSAFVKGDINSTATFELDFLLRMLSGMGAGSVEQSGCVPPVVEEFRALCGKYRLKTGTVERQEVVLDIVKNPAHYEKSRFLHQLLYLEAGFGKLESGPDYVNGRDRNLARETWICRYGTQVETRLIDLSVYGSTLSQVCSSLIERSFRDNLTAEDLGKLLLSVQVMGVESFYERYFDSIVQVIEADRNFVSLCRLGSSLRYLSNMQQLMEGAVKKEIPALLGKAFRAATEQISAVKTVSEDEEQLVCEQLKELYALSVELPQWCDGQLFAVQTGMVLEDSFCNSRFYGVCLAVHNKLDQLSMEEFCARITAYLESAAGQPEQLASFVCGVFLAGRDALFADDAILERIDVAIRQMDQEAFLTVLPNLRYAFTCFLPMELDRIGEMVANHYGFEDTAIHNTIEITQEDLALGMRLDHRAEEEMQKWGIGLGR